MTREQPVQGTETFLRELLKRTSEAHGVYEHDQLGGVYDEDWPPGTPPIWRRRSPPTAG